MHLLSGGAAQGLVNALKPSIEKTTDTQLSCTFGAVGLMKQKLLEIGKSEGASNGANA